MQFNGVSQDYEPQNDKINKVTCATSEDSSTQSDQSLYCPHDENLGL